MSRKIIYTLLVLPLIAGATFLSITNADARRGFLSEYSRNLKRLVAGEWELSELRDSPRENDRSFDRNQRRYGHAGPARIFAKLDKDSSGTLEANELGKRMASRVGEFEAITRKEFESVVYREWSPTLDASLRGTGAATENAGSEGSPTKLTHDELLDPDHVMDVRIDIPESDWHSLCHQSRSHYSAVQDPLAKPYTNFRANVVIDNVPIPDVAIRKKGFIGSQDTVRPSLKIKFDEYVDQAPVDGLERLTLNNNRQDRALVSQALTYFLFRKAGLAAPRSTFAKVTVNGRYLGVYTHVESVKKPFLRRTFGADSGPLYEGTLTDLYPASIEWIEPKTSESENDSRCIQRLADILADDAATLDEIASLVDIDAFLKYWAIENLINFWDGYNQNQNNYFIAQNPNNDLVYFIPWGADSCFGRRPRFTQRPGENAEAVRATGILSNKLYRFDGLPDRYRTTMRQVLDEVWDEQELLNEIDRIETLLHDHLDSNQIGAIVASDEVRKFIRGRREVIVDELDNAWPVRIADGPRIPRHDVILGTATGSFVREQDGTYLLDAAMTLDDQPVELESIEIDDWTIRLTGTCETRSIEVQLAMQDRDRMMGLGAKQADTKENRIKLQGDVSILSYRGVEVRGHLGSPQYDDSHRLREGNLEFQVIETRGGFMDRW